MADMLRNIWDSTLGKAAVICIAVGAAPIILLSYAHAALTR